VPEGARLEHVPFGLVQGDDGKKLKTRSGDTVRLKDLLDEAVQRAEADLQARLAQEDRREEQAFIAEVATSVGLGAVKYADLATNRITNYQFSFDRMLAMQGNTAPYLLYALVRLAGIARKGGEAATSGGDGQITGLCSDQPLQFHEPQEWALVRHLLAFDAVIAEVEEELLPNRLCAYLFELSQVFNRFYDQVPVLKAPPEARGSRLALCRLTADTLKQGLRLLGIQTLTRM
jgi:arginyl-tRNA synthetase